MDYEKVYEKMKQSNSFEGMFSIINKNLKDLNSFYESFTESRAVGLVFGYIYNTSFDANNQIRWNAFNYDSREMYYMLSLLCLRKIDSNKLRNIITNNGFEDILNVSSNTRQYVYTKNFILKYFIPIISFEIDDIITIGDEIKVRNSISKKQYKFDALTMINKPSKSKNNRRSGRFDDDTNTLFAMLGAGMLGAALLDNENEQHNERHCDSHENYDSYNDSYDSGYDSYDSSDSSSDSSSSSCD